MHATLEKHETLIYHKNVSRINHGLTDLAKHAINMARRLFRMPSAEGLEKCRNYSLLMNILRLINVALNTSVPALKILLLQ